MRKKKKRLKLYLHKKLAIGPQPYWVEKLLEILPSIGSNRRLIKLKGRRFTRTSGKRILLAWFAT